MYAQKILREKHLIAAFQRIAVFYVDSCPHVSWELGTTMILSCGESESVPTAVIITVMYSVTSVVTEPREASGATPICPHAVGKELPA